jgi:hypothetical protein
MYGMWMFDGDQRSSEVFTRGLQIKSTETTFHHIDYRYDYQIKCEIGGTCSMHVSHENAHKMLFQKAGEIGVQ